MGAPRWEVVVASLRRHQSKMPIVAAGILGFPAIAQIKRRRRFTIG